MAITNFPNGISSFGMPILGSPFVTQGKYWFVKPSSGSDAWDGTTPDTAFKTLAKALSAATANRNDIVFLFSESDTAASTTDYQSATLDWNKDLVHLVGVGSPSPMSNRARVAFISTYVTASNLFTLSADGCIVNNIAFFAEVASANPTGAFLLTGSRNYIHRCHIAGIGHDTMDTAGAYTLKVDGAQECEFNDCRIGLNTIAAGTAANSEILIDSATKNVMWRNCHIFRRIEHATNHPLVKLADATAIEEMIEFEDCRFISTSTNYGTIQSGAFKLTADLTQGIILISGGKTLLYNGPLAAAGKWDVDDRDKIKIMLPVTPAADTAGITRAV
jgi:hypothetical protein